MPCTINHVPPKAIAYRNRLSSKIAMLTPAVLRSGANMPAIRISSTAEHGLDPDWVEACAFAWLAMRALASVPGNAPGVTGASRPTILGALHRSG